MVEPVRAFNVSCKPSMSSSSSPSPSPDSGVEQKVNGVANYSSQNDAVVVDELVSTKQAVKAWQTKANGMQKRNELLEAEILLLRSSERIVNGENGEEEEENDGEGDENGEESEVTQLRSQIEKLLPLEEELADVKEELAEVTELYENLLRQRNTENRLKRYSSFDGDSNKAKIIQLQVQMEGLKVKHKEELLEKDSELKLSEERTSKAKAKAIALRKELEDTKGEKLNLQVEKRKLERKLQKIYSAKQQWKEQTEETIKEMEVSTLKLRTTRLQVELQRAYSTPSPLGSSFGSQENLLDSLNRSHDGSKVLWSVTSPVSESPTVDAMDNDTFSTGSRERELETEVESLKEDIQTLEIKLSTKSKEYEDCIQQLEEKLSDAEQKSTTLQTELEKSKEEAKLLANDLETAELTVDELNSQLNDKEEELSETCKALEEVKEELRNVPSDVVLLQQQTMELQQQLNKTIAQLAEAKEQLQKEIIAVSWKNEELSQLRNRLQS
ncbi:putative leucine-rich repeat-containing protein DDB_G0290503 [Dysidea avara]|uniref:putative leucine-rich repeat-containing protein DDB_G0290503 n=1 Tax=Dysidea avara TaxID=196820 RepID=UPI003333CC90